MKTKILHGLGALLGLILFSGALWVLHQELKAYHFHEGKGPSMSYEYYEYKDYKHAGPHIDPFRRRRKKPDIG
jgi:hypothetical protein